MIVFAKVIQPQIEWLMGMPNDLSAYSALAGNASVAIKLLSFALSSAAFGEEILFRGFLLHQLSAILGRSSGPPRRDCGERPYLRSGAPGAGPVGVVMSALVGLVFAWAWFRNGRNLRALILAHALIDTYGIAMLYLGLLA